MTDGFENLSDYDFERLVADLLTAEWSTHVESFPRGRDGGVDLRVLGPTDTSLRLASGDELVVQCKHHPLASYDEIKGGLAKEAKKAIVNEASRYLLATSARLTRLNKKSIVDLYSKRIAEADILGREDIAALVRRHPAVERATPKLWMLSGSLLSSLLHHMESLRSENLRSELTRLQRTFVETKFIAKARETIDELGICILAGPPGVGKTTTAHILLLQLMAEGWEPITAVGDVRELEAQISTNAKQVLFFDDFLGQNSLDAKLKVGGDSELVRLLRLVEADPRKIFIMTTRDYVLRQAQQSYERLNHEIFDASRVSVKSEALSLHEKAHILYNQLYFSPLRSLARQSPSKDYVKVACHPKFNPRLTEAAISLLTRANGLHRHPRNGKPKDQPLPQSSSPTVPARLLEALERPEGLWDHVLRYQLTELQRDILLARYSFGTIVVRVDELYKAVRSMYQLNGQHCLEVDLDAAISVLDGDLLHLNWEDRKNFAVAGLNPGLADAVGDFLLRYPDQLQGIVRSAPFYEQVRTLAGLCGYFVRNQPPSGVFSPRLVELEQDMLKGVERTLFTAGALTSSLPLIRPRYEWYEIIGERLKLYLALCGLTGQTPPQQMIEDAINGVLVNVRKMRASHLLALAQTLRAAIPTNWRPTRTRFEHGLLKRMSNPRDVEEWSILRDIIDVVPVTDDFLRNMEDKFDEFAQFQIDEIVDQLQDDPNGDEEASIDEIKAVATQWSRAVDTWEAEQLIEEQLQESDGKGFAPDDDAGPTRPPHRQYTPSAGNIDPVRLFDLL
ncbi:ATP-binding protein [Micromonospora aurantiaca]|uniref:ATP-binding protein n=1 Tax=Micromonospora aurantiaca (nom. illeg.) TaxID=47850 RepID=UPI0013C2C1D5|nr:ATP-binding protein [Micromonospora aurantiaca]